MRHVLKVADPSTLISIKFRPQGGILGGEVGRVGWEGRLVWRAGREPRACIAGMDS